MEHQLKSISKAGIPEAIAKAELYRYLNEPEEAESICRDILAVDPGHQLARRMLGLAITDQFIGAASDRYIEVQSDRKSTRLNSSHGYISYAVFCLKKKKKKQNFIQHCYVSYLCVRLLV